MVGGWGEAGAGGLTASPCLAQEPPPLIVVQYPAAHWRHSVVSLGPFPAGPRATPCFYIPAFPATEFPNPRLQEGTGEERGNPFLGRKQPNLSETLPEDLGLHCSPFCSYYLETLSVLRILGAYVEELSETCKSLHSSFYKLCYSIEQNLLQRCCYGHVELSEASLPAP